MNSFEFAKVSTNAKANERVCVFLHICCHVLLMFFSLLLSVCKHVTCQVRDTNHQITFRPRPPSASPFRRATSACATPAGRGTSASGKRTNVYLSRAKTAPLAPTFPTASSRCASRLDRWGEDGGGEAQFTWVGGLEGERLSRSMNAVKRRRATYPSASSGGNELQVAGKTNESINGSQHE